MIPPTDHPHLQGPRDGLLKLLAAHKPADAKEAADLLLIQQMIIDHEDILNPGCGPGHITASALILDADRGDLLFHYHRHLKRWLQVGGHVNEGETDPSQTALREAREETGLLDLSFFPTALLPAPLDIDAHPIPATDQRTAHLHLDFRYLLSTKTPDEVRASANESGLFRWLSFEEFRAIDKEFDPGLGRLVSKAESLFQEHSRLQSR